MTPKEEQKKHLIDMMKDDEKLGLYEERAEATQTAVEWLISEIQRLNDSGYEFHPKYNEELIEQAKEMEKQQAHEYAEFAIICDRKDMKILEFDGYINLETFKSE